MYKLTAFKNKFVIRIYLILIVTCFQYFNGFAQKISIDSLNHSGMSHFEITGTNAEFPGGEQALSKYIQTEVSKYLQKKDSLINARTYVKFTVKANGTIEFNEIIRSSSSTEIDALAKEIITKMPKWKPSLKFETHEPIDQPIWMPIVVKN